MGLWFKFTFKLMIVSKFHSHLSATPCPTVGWAFVSVAIFQLPSDWPHDFHCCSLLLLNKREERRGFNLSVIRGVNFSASTVDYKWEWRSQIFFKIFYNFFSSLLFSLVSVVFPSDTKSIQIYSPKSKNFSQKNCFTWKMLRLSTKKSNGSRFIYGRTKIVPENINC
jgi:hypothetical protein